jgi:hypothetical protein
MAAVKTKIHAYIQIVPLLACAFFAWVSYTEHRLAAAGNGDAELLIYILPFMAIAYVILPLFIMLDLGILWRTIHDKDYRQTGVVVGLLLIGITYWLAFGAS